MHFPFFHPLVSGFTASLPLQTLNHFDYNFVFDFTLGNSGPVTYIPPSFKLLMPDIVNSSKDEIYALFKVNTKKTYGLDGDSPMVLKLML